jgi:hypothetical protein
MSWPLYLHEKASVTHRTGGCLDPRAGLDVLEVDKKNIILAGC